MNKFEYPSHLILLANKTDPQTMHSVGTANTWHPCCHSPALKPQQVRSPHSRMAPPLNSLSTWAPSLPPVPQTAATNESVLMYMSDIYWSCLEEWKEQIFPDKSEFEYHICSLLPAKS